MIKDVVFVDSIAYGLNLGRSLYHRIFVPPLNLNYIEKDLITK